MADALILCPEAPYPVAGGGPTRTACMLEYLASRYSLDVITFREPGARDPRDAFPAGLVRDVAVVDLPYHSKTPAARAYRNLGRMLRGAPPLVDRFAGFALPVRRKYDLAVIEHFWCAPYVSQLRPTARRVVLDLHNIESVLLDRCAGTEPLPGRVMFRRFATACRTMESEFLPAFDLLLVTSAVDQKQAGGGVICPNAIPLVPMPERPRRDEIVFSGNLAYHPNVAAARFFAAEIWPRIRTSRPELTWVLAGKNPEALGLSGAAGVKFTGPMEDAIETLAGAKVAVVPLLSGSGTRFKILEAWAAGVPVVSTTAGAEGLEAIPGVHLIIADSPETFARAVVSVVDDHVLAEKLRVAGRRRFEESYTWPGAWKILESVGL